MLLMAVDGSAQGIALALVKSGDQKQQGSEGHIYIYIFFRSCEWCVLGMKSWREEENTLVFLLPAMPNSTSNMRDPKMGS